MKPTAARKMTIMQAKLFFFIFVWLVGTTAIAEDASKEKIPDIALLEFLGSFEDPDGKWIDPMEIDSMMNKETTENDATTAKKESNDE